MSASPVSPFTQWPARPRFTLRALLILLTLVAAFFAWYGPWKAAKHREEKARQWILNHGGSVGQFNGWEIERRGWWIRGLSLVVPRDCLYTVKSVYFEKADDTMLHCFVDLPHLQTADLHDSRVTDNGLIHLQHLNDMRTLNLASTKIGDDGCRHLSKNRRLEQLWLGDTRVSGTSLPWIAQNRGLTHLSLAGTDVTDQDIARLVELQRLEVLALHNTNTHPNLK